VILMFAIIRLVRAFINKEEITVYRYNRAHPHFKWFLGLDALLATFLIFGGFAFASQPASSFQTTQLQHAGAVAMSSSEFTNHVHAYNIMAYWLGPISGYKYTHVDNSLSVITVTYWTKNADINFATESKLTVATYENIEAYTTTVHPLEDPNTVKIVSASGTTVRFSEAAIAMNYEIVTFKGKPEIIVVNYSTWQLATTLMKNAEALRLVS